jgi:membrane-anchored protein YejM (alkaline phosphatase superfamily)
MQPTASRRGNPAVSFGWSYSIAAVVTAIVFAVKALNPGLDEWAEELFGHAWLYQGVLGLLLFVGLGLAPFGKRDLRGVAFLVLGSTLVSGLIIVAAAAVAAAA